MLRSDDDGATWRSAALGLDGTTAGSLASDPTRAGTFYAASSAGLFKTTSGGLAPAAAARPARAR